MTFAMTWSEELVAEWLAVEGYVVETNIPLGSGRGGGRREADVVGIRFKDGVFNIVHAEVASLPSSPEKELDRFQKKFKWGKEKLGEYFKEKLEIKRRINLEQIIVATYSSQRVRDKINKGLPKVKFFTFKSLIEEIMPTVNKYVKKDRVFPANYWFLNLLRQLKCDKIDLK